MPIELNCCSRATILKSSTEENTNRLFALAAGTPVRCVAVGSRISFVVLDSTKVAPMEFFSTTGKPARESAGTPKVSVIIPVYNTEQYLRECLDSVCAQTLRELEIICIDDGSTDRSREILEEFRSRDERIRLIAQGNRGLGAARNRGLEIACGKFLAFVDSDDAVLPEIWSESVKKAEAENLDFVLFEAETRSRENLDRDNWLKLFLPQKYEHTPFTWQKIQHELFRINCCACTKLVRRDFWRERRFPENVLYEDAVLHFDLMLSANRIGIIKKPLYFYRSRENSLMKTQDLRVLDHLKIIDGVAEILWQKNAFPQLQKRFLNYAENLLIQTFDFCPTSECFSAISAWLRSRKNWPWQCSRALKLFEENNFVAFTNWRFFCKSKSHKHKFPFPRFFAKFFSFFILNKSARRRWRERYKI